MPKIKYNQEELEILKYIEKGRPKSISNVKKEMAKYRKLFQENSMKRKAISLRILEGDLMKIKSQALIEGIPYQTLIGSVLHKYVNGNLVSKS